MKALCYFLMSIIGAALFFWMMIGGWGLKIQSIVPIIVYYVWLIVHMTIVCATSNK